MKKQYHFIRTMILIFRFQTPVYFVNSLKDFRDFQSQNFTVSSTKYCDYCFVYHYIIQIFEKGNPQESFLLFTSFLKVGCLTENELLFFMKLEIPPKKDVWREICKKENYREITF